MSTLLNPYLIFNNWLNFAKASKLVKDATAFNLATCNNNEPDNRIVLLKEVLEGEGLVFFTNKNSKKGMDIAANSKASACFYWDRLNLQIRVKGDVSELKAEQSDAYFESRSLASRLGACVSRQSSKLKSRSSLLADYQDFAANQGMAVAINNNHVLTKSNKDGLILIDDSLQICYATQNFDQNLLNEIDILAGEITLKQDSNTNKSLQRPQNWGGFLINPQSFEFWVNGDHRLHDRTLFTKITEPSGNAAWQVCKLYP